MFPKPAAEHPEWKWKMMWEAWTMLCDLDRKRTYCHPDNFGMHVYTDFYGYGLNEMIEKLLSARQS